jgi:predicted Rossmann-fold nucleotide-binding protein
MPDIEKRLEAFLRLAHCVVVFPGGAGTTEEILYLLGVLLDPRNADQMLPIVFTGPAASAAYFDQIRAFIEGTLGADVLGRLQFIVGDPADTARQVVADIGQVRSRRRASNDSYNFNWLLQVPEAFQHPFEATHEHAPAGAAS